MKFGSFNFQKGSFKIRAMSSAFHHSVNNYFELIRRGTIYPDLKMIQSPNPKPNPLRCKYQHLNLSLQMHNMVPTPNKDLMRYFVNL